MSKSGLISLASGIARAESDLTEAGMIDFIATSKSPCEGVILVKSKLSLY